MIIHCDSCGKAVSNRLEKCPFCTFAVRTRHDELPNGFNPSLEDLIPTFQKRSIY